VCSLCPLFDAPLKVPWQCPSPSTGAGMHAMLQAVMQAAADAILTGYPTREEGAKPNSASGELETWAWRSKTHMASDQHTQLVKVVGLELLTTCGSIVPPSCTTDCVLCSLPQHVCTRLICKPCACRGCTQEQHSCVYMTAHTYIHIHRIYVHENGRRNSWHHLLHGCIPMHVPQRL
jgi:hypothetical protein